MNTVLRYSTCAVKENLRALLRETAQSVAVVTSFMPGHSNLPFHGATLSSFTSIAMDPYPLITFALRLPSRMASTLNSTPDTPSHMVINLLSAQQATVAIKFSRPDLHPDPFATIPYQLTEEGLPIIDGSLGAVSCKLVSKAIPLHDLAFLGRGALGSGEMDSVSKPVLGASMVASELFIARVTRVEALAAPEEGEEGSSRTLPLLYHRRGFTSCQPNHIPVKTK